MNVGIHEVGVEFGMDVLEDTHVATFAKGFLVAHSSALLWQIVFMVFIS